MSDGSTAKVTITYCAECGYEPQTLALTEALMKAFSHQLTAIELLTGAPRVTVGCPGSVLHSSKLPMEECAKPLPLRVTDWPFTRPVDGVTVKVPTAKADKVVPSKTDPTTTSSEAAIVMRRARPSRLVGSAPRIVDRRDEPFTRYPLFDPTR